jgi:thiol-disulfide isomerase/thioredoxin
LLAVKQQQQQQGWLLLVLAWAADEEQTRPVLYPSSACDSEEGGGLGRVPIPGREVSAFQGKINNRTIMSGRFSAVEMLDLFRKVPNDLIARTESGGSFSIVGLVVMLILFYVEFWGWMSPPYEGTVSIDGRQSMEFMPIRFNITMMDLPCEYVSVDVYDALGYSAQNVTRLIDKWHLSGDRVKGVYAGRNLEQHDIVMFDEEHVDLAALHANGIHSVPLSTDSYVPWLQEHDWTFVAFHAPWCGWCKKLLPTWEAFAERAEASLPTLTVVQVDCVENPKLCQDAQVKAYPTMRLLKGDEFVTDYRQDRTVDMLMRFAELHVTSPKGATLDMGTGVHNSKFPGCQVSGLIMANPVPGTFQIEARSLHHNFNPAMTNLSHIINSLAIGEEPRRVDANRISRILPAQHTQLRVLDSNVYVVDAYHKAPHHYIKVVPTDYRMRDRAPIRDYQMVALSQMMHYEVDQVPEAKFTYEFSPLVVSVAQEETHWIDFMTHLCAIVGGTFSVLGLLDSLFYKLFGSFESGINR